MEVGGSPSKNKLFISLERMADGQDSQVKCLDSPTGTYRLVSINKLQKLQQWK